MFNNLLLDIILILSLRFFLFDFYLFQNIWKFIKTKYNNYFTQHFFQCPFCQGFWVGFFYSLIILPYSFWLSFFFGFITAFLSYVYYFLTYNLFYISEMKKIIRLKRENK